MKLISWNVNGIRACIGKGFEESFAALDADIFCLQKTKCQQGQVKLELPGYYQYWNYANRRGYSGTAVFTKKEPLSVAYGIGIEEHDKEGRVITLEYEKFYLVTVYTPNSQSELRRLEYRMHWEDRIFALPNLAGYRKWKKVIDTSTVKENGFLEQEQETYSKKLKVTPRTIVVLMAVEEEKKDASVAAL